MSEEVKQLRERIMRAVAVEVKKDNGHKSYEGQLSIGEFFGGYFEQSAHYFYISLDCYVLGPHRHYEWTGVTLEDAIAKVHASLDKWEVAR